MSVFFQEEDKTSLLPKDDFEVQLQQHGFRESFKRHVHLLYLDLQAWGKYSLNWALTHYPLGPVRVYPPAESANFVVVNNQRERLRNSQRKKNEGAFKVGFRWVCLVFFSF